MIQWRRRASDSHYIYGFSRKWRQRTPPSFAKSSNSHKTRAKREYFILNFEKWEVESQKSSRIFRRFTVSHNVHHACTCTRWSTGGLRDCEFRKDVYIYAHAWKQLTGKCDACTLQLNHMWVIDHWLYNYTSACTIYVYIVHTCVGYYYIDA